MFPAGRKHGKKTRAARSRTREKPSCRKILTLCKVPERGAPKPLLGRRIRAGPGRPEARRKKGRRRTAPDELRTGATRERSGIDAGKGPGHAKPVSPFPAMSPMPRGRGNPPPNLRGAPLRVRPGAEAERPCPEARRNARRKTPERGTKKVRPDPSSCNGIRPGAIRKDDANADYLSTPTSL